MTIAPPALLRRVGAELLGSAALATVVVGSGIAAAGLSSDVGVQLLINAVATAMGLFVIITVLAPISGAHLNPVVSLADAHFGLRGARDIVPYICAQVVGCILGTVLANSMFDIAAVSWSTTDRITLGHLIGEVVATAGLVFVIFTLAKTQRSEFTPLAVAAYIGSAYFFTSSTSFANPAITIGRMFSNTFAGISPTGVPLFVAAQLVGAALGVIAVRALVSGRPALRRTRSSGS